MPKNRQVIASLACMVVAAGALAVGSAGAASPDDPAGEPATIEIKLGKKGPTFSGPKTVQAGSELAVANLTSPKKIGPHTLTLAREKLIPSNRKEGEACYAKDGLCRSVGKAHKQGKLQLAKGGKPGWDRKFSRKQTGDSWFTAAENETYTAPVAAKPGKVLHYFCAIHPVMQGQIKVVGNGS